MSDVELREQDWPHVDAVFEWLRTRTKNATGAALSTADGFGDLKVWLEREGRPGVPFGPFAHIARRAGFPLVRRAGVKFLTGLELKQ